MLIARSDVVAGTSVIMRDLCSGLEPYGITTTAIAGGAGPFLSDLHAHGVRYRAIPSLGQPISPSHDLRAAVQLRKILRKLDPDLLVCHGSKAGLLGRVVGRQMSIPVVYTAHGWKFDDGVPRRKKNVRLLVEKASARFLPSTVIDVCEHDRLIAVEHGVGDPSVHLVVRNGIPDVDRAFRSEPAAGPPHIVMIARFTPQKDHATLIGALARLQDREWTAELVGSGEGLGAARAQALQLGLGDRITFCGEVSRPQDYLARAQIFALTSNWEGLPLTLLEAMRAGLPSVVSSVGGVSEALDDGVTGLLVPRASTGAVAAALGRLIDEPETRAAMGARAREKYSKEFTADRMLEDMAEIYRRLVRGETGGAMPQVGPA